MGLAWLPRAVLASRSLCQRQVGRLGDRRGLPHTVGQWADRQRTRVPGPHGGCDGVLEDSNAASPGPKRSQVCTRVPARPTGTKESRARPGPAGGHPRNTPMGHRDGEGAPCHVPNPAGCWPHVETHSTSPGPGSHLTSGLRPGSSRCKDPGSKGSAPAPKPTLCRRPSTWEGGTFRRPKSFHLAEVPLHRLRSSRGVHPSVCMTLRPVTIWRVSETFEPRGPAAPAFPGALTISRVHG